MKHKSKKGMSLLEMIFALTMVAILGAMVVTVMGRKINKSADPLIVTGSASSAESTMETIIKDYVRFMNDNSLGPSNVLNTLITSNSNGTYGTGVTMSHIRFTGGNEIADPSGPLLKVSVKRGEKSLSVILTQSRNSISDGTINF